MRPIIDTDGNTGEWMELKQAPGDPSRKSAPVSINMSLPLNKFCGRRQGYPRALFQAPLSNDTGR